MREGKGGAATKRRRARPSLASSRREPRKHRRVACTDGPQGETKTGMPANKGKKWIGQVKGHLRADMICITANTING